jgi:hypothetical protein
MQTAWLLCRRWSGVVSGSAAAAGIELGFWGAAGQRIAKNGAYGEPTGVPVNSGIYDLTRADTCRRLRADITIARSGNTR